MGTLDDVRKQLQSPKPGEQESEQPETALTPHDQAAQKRGEKYVVVSNYGQQPDVRLLFGAHRGQLVSRLSKDGDGRRYLEWICNNEFPAELKSLCKFWLNQKGL